MAIKVRPIIDRIVQEYPLPLDGCHGIAHWARVLEIGQRLSANPEVDEEVVLLFALFHDSRRINEGHDPEHGIRAANFARQLRGKLFDLDDQRFDVLYEACCWHTHERTHENITIQACWDSDRLDLGRVGIVPDPYYLGTPEARQREMIQWAHGRASFRVVPEWVSAVWDIPSSIASLD